MRLLACRFTAVFSFTLLATLCSHGQQLTPMETSPAVPRSHSISLTTKVVSSGGGSEASHTSKDEHGHFRGAAGAKLDTSTLENKTTQSRQISLSIAVRNFAAQPDKVKLEVYFFGEPVNVHKLFIFDSAASDLTLSAGETQNISIVSKESKVTTTQQMTSAQGYQTLFNSRENGVKIKGWMSRVVADGKVLQVQASDMKYEALGKDDKQLSGLGHPGGK